MVDICAMILNNITKNCSVLIATILLFSCESMRDLVGLSDENIEQELISSTPELVLPPDFEKIPKPGSISKTIEDEDEKIKKILKVPKIDNINKKSSSIEESILDSIRK